MQGQGQGPSVQGPGQGQGQGQGPSVQGPGQGQGQRPKTELFARSYSYLRPRL